MIKCWEKRTEAILPVFFRFRQVSFYIEIFENFYTKRLQVRKIYLSLHSRLRKTSNTAEHGAVVQLVRMRACHARGRGFEPHPHRLKALHESEGLFRIWTFRRAGSARQSNMPSLFFLDSPVMSMTAGYPSTTILLSEPFTRWLREEKTGQGENPVYYAFLYYRVR